LGIRHPIDPDFGRSVHHNEIHVTGFSATSVAPEFKLVHYPRRLLPAYRRRLWRERTVDPYTGAGQSVDIVTERVLMDIEIRHTSAFVACEARRGRVINGIELTCTSYFSIFLFFFSRTGMRRSRHGKACHWTMNSFFFQNLTGEVETGGDGSNGWSLPWEDQLIRCQAANLGTNRRASP
jgi:hypothetical protein